MADKIDLETFKKMVFNCGYFDVGMTVPTHGRFYEMLAKTTEGLSVINTLIESDEISRMSLCKNEPRLFNDDGRLAMIRLTGGVINMINWICHNLIDEMNSRHEQEQERKQIP